MLHGNTMCLIVVLHYWCEMIVHDAVLYSSICCRYSKVRAALTKEMELETIIQGVSTCGSNKGQPKLCLCQLQSEVLTEVKVG